MTPLPLTDPKWQSLRSGYLVYYDARPLIERFKGGKDDSNCWAEVWAELHHQGDVGEASYAIVPWLARIFEHRRRDWNLYGYLVTLEVCRAEPANRHAPDIPDWLDDDYEAALETILRFAFDDVQDRRDDMTIMQILSFIAAKNGALAVAECISNLPDYAETNALAETYGGFTTTID